jgi:hypothetical protein
MLERKGYKFIFKPKKGIELVCKQDIALENAPLPSPTISTT